MSAFGGRAEVAPRWALAKLGFLNQHGKPFVAASIKSILA